MTNWVFHTCYKNIYSQYYIIYVDKNEYELKKVLKRAFTKTIKIQKCNVKLEHIDFANLIHACLHSTSAFSHYCLFIWKKANSQESIFIVKYLHIHTLVYSSKKTKQKNTLFLMCTFEIK